LVPPPNQTLLKIFKIYVEYECWTVLTLA